MLKFVMQAAKLTAEIEKFRAMSPEERAASVGEQLGMATRRMVERPEFREAIGYGLAALAFRVLGGDFEPNRAYYVQKAREAVASLRT